MHSRSAFFVYLLYYNQLCMNKNLPVIITLFICLVIGSSCNDNKDDGSRGFMSTATIIGDTTNGFYCYLDGGELVISYDKNLADAERGYFSFYYNEEDWETSTNGEKFINNAHVVTWSKYEVIHPISQEEANDTNVAENCQLPSLLGIGYGYRGYFDLHAGFSTFNSITGEKIQGKISLVYDPQEQTQDSLKLQLYYNPNTPDDWSKTQTDYETVSCDISSLVNLQQWKDSVTIVVKSGDKEKHHTKISKNDFLKPGKH